MAYTYDGLAAEIQNEVDDQTSDALTAIKQYINDIGEEIWQEEAWSFRDATVYLNSVANQQTLDLTTLITDLGKINVVGYKGENETEFFPLNEISIQTLRNRYTDTTTASKPVVWAWYNGLLYFAPIPNYSGTNNIQIDYDKNWTDLTADADVPGIPVKYKRVLKAGVKAMFWNFDDDLRESPAWQTYLRFLGSMRAEDLDRTLTPHRGRLLRP